MSKSILSVALIIPFCLSTVACAVETGDVDEPIEAIGADAEAIHSGSSTESAEIEHSVAAWDEWNASAEFVAEGGELVQPEPGAGSDGAEEDSDTNYQYCMQQCCNVQTNGECGTDVEFQHCHNICTGVPVEEDAQPVNP